MDPDPDPDPLPGLDILRRQRLQAVAQAALDGLLEAEELAGLPPPVPAPASRAPPGAPGAPGADCTSGPSRHG